MAEIGKIWGKEPGDLAEFNQVDAGNISKIYGVDFSQGIKIPVGSIVPFRGAGSIPTGWSQFTVAEGDFIIGAGSSYSVGANGAGSGNINLTHTAAGTHLGAAAMFGSGIGFCGQTTDPNHQHTTMTFSGPMPYYQQTRLIQASSEQDNLPQDACLLKHSSGGWTGLTRLAPSLNRHFRCDSADGTGGVLTNSVLSSNDNNHDHGGVDGLRPAGGGGGAWGAQLSMLGTHQHSFAATLTFNLYRLRLSAWYNASGAYDLDGSNFIVMYENLTPPDGWALCDGNNGTPDMRDRFIELPLSDSDAGNSDGTGKVLCVSATDTAGAHTHKDIQQCNSCPRVAAYHYEVIGGHSHTCNLDLTWLPPYYALAFIMYTG
jgi:hypothetical protein